MAVQDRQFRHAARIQARRHAADGERRALHDGRDAPRRRRARRQDGRNPVGLQHARRQTRGYLAAAAFRSRRILLDRRSRRRAHPLHHDGLSAGGAECQDRQADPLIWPRPAWSISRSAYTPARASRSISETGEAGLHSTALMVKDAVIVGVSMKEGHTPVTHDNTKGAVRAYRRPHRQADVDLQHDSSPGRIRQRYLGERLVGDQRQHRRVDADVGR